MNKDIHILFGLRIKELRVRAHISQEELSFRSGLSKNYISVYPAIPVEQVLPVD